MQIGYIQVCCVQCEIATVLSRFDVKALNELVVKSNVSVAFMHTSMMILKRSLRGFLYSDDEF